MARWWCAVVVVALWCGGVRGCNKAQSRRQPTPARPTQAPKPVSSTCRGVDLLEGTPTPVQSSVLASLCQKTLDLTRLKTSMSATSSQATSGNTRPRPVPPGQQQAAMVLLHRDDFSNQIRWESGGSTVDAVNAPGWQVDAESPLTNGYTWYSHGLPAWPLLHQASLGKKKKLDWPNYAIATPVYLAANEASNSRDINISVRKLFAGDFRPQQTGAGTVSATNAQGSFSDAAKFKGTVERIVADGFLDQNGAVRRDLIGAVRDPATWLRPLVIQSLPEMLDSFAARQARAPKGGVTTVCPDELYVYFRQEPCTTAANCQIVQDVTGVLRAAGCINTQLVVGYTLPAAAGRGPA